MGERGPESFSVNPAIDRYENAICILGQFAPILVEYAHLAPEIGDLATIREMKRAEGIYVVSERDLMLSWGVHQLDRDAAQAQWKSWLESGKTTPNDIAEAFFRLAEAGIL